MVPRDHGFGKSFIGVGDYLLHDKDHANTNDRVAWTHCHNMGTQDADTAFKVMAAVAMDQTRLKKQAHDAAQAELPEDERKSFRNAGRKSSDHVWHYTLAWPKEQADSLTKEDMIEAAKSTLSILGKGKTKTHARAQFADEHQAIFVCHQDEPHPHVHVVVNRVHPEHGNMLSKYNDWQRFSRWAQKYEQEQEKVYCHQRVANNRLRDDLAARGEQLKVYGKGHLPHHMAKASDFVREAANDNTSPQAKIIEDERRKTAELAEKGRQQAQQNAETMRRLREQYQAKRLAIRANIEKAAKIERAKVYAEYQPQQTYILQDQEYQVAQFEQREQDLKGKARNVWEAVKARWHVQQSDDRQFRLSDYYKPITGEGERLAAFKESLRLQQRQLEIEREKRLTDATAVLQAKVSEQRDQARIAYADRRAQLLAQHEKQRDELKEEWLHRKQERDASLLAAQEATQRVKSDALPQNKADFNKAAVGLQTADERGDTDTGAASPPSSSSVPDHIRQAKTELERFIERQQERGRGRDNEQDRER